jgi:hypothetical protein
MIYESSLNHKGNSATFKDIFCVFDNSLPSVRWFFVSAIWTPPYTLEGHIWLISSSLSTIQLYVGAQIVGLRFLFGHEIQKSTPQKFADLWDTKCSVTGLDTLCSSPQCVWLQVQICFVWCTFYGRFKVQTYWVFQCQYQKQIWMPIRLSSIFWG